MQTGCVYFKIFLFSFLAGLFSVVLLKLISAKFKFLLREKVPMTGGIAIAIAFLYVFGFMSNILYPDYIPVQIKGIILASMMILISGIIDDFIELSVGAKLCIQLICVAVLIYSGVMTKIVYIGYFANLLITFLWVVGITNAFNHLDVLDGVAAAAAFIISVSFGFISWLHQDTVTLVMALSIAGSVFSFLVFNFPPAKIYMGNSGSHFLGFFFSAMALSISYAPMERKVALLTPLLILGFPIFDTAFLIIMRIRNKKLPFEKSQDHIALRILSTGISKRTTLCKISILCVFFCICGITVSQANNLFGLVIVALAIFMGLLITSSLGKVTVNG